VILTISPGWLEETVSEEIIDRHGFPPRGRIMAPFARDFLAVQALWKAGEWSSPESGDDHSPGRRQT
jgi:hypothetical protein